MREITGDLWNFRPVVDGVTLRVDAVCIPTNGMYTVRNDVPRAVMGRGVAYEAARRYPGLREYLGLELKQRGNIPMSLIRAGNNPSEDPILVSFPTKNHWRNKSSLRLIARSAYRLAQKADINGWEVITLPRPGCGNGGLDWTVVKAIIGPVLDDRFIIVHKAGGDA